MKGDKMAALDALGIDTVCDAISDGVSMNAIAAKADVSIGTLLNWLDADSERSARAREARTRTARLWDDKALEVLEKAPDGFELSRAKELAHHYRWRASKIAPREYGDKLAVGGAADLPPLQSTVALDAGDAYKLLLGGEK